MKKSFLVLLAVLLLPACKQKQSQGNNSFTPFERASNQYLIDTKAVKTECSQLFSDAVLKAINSKNKPMVCGKLTLEANLTRQMLDIAHGKNQAGAWEAGPFMSGIFAIDDNVLMPVMIFPQENAIVFQGD